MVRRPLRYLTIGVGGLFLAFVALVAVSYLFPPTYEASTALQGTTSTVVVQLQPMHPYLAEYKRALVLRKPGVSDVRQKMFPDTGGYSRTWLYRLKDGRFLIEGAFDSFVVDAVGHTISDAPKVATTDAALLGVFADTGDGQWRFIAGSQGLPRSRGLN
jgi:hypothetical protein